ncbi:MAG: patatin-like phospholipase family protein [Cytophagales bacterium]|nr:patatin-like phospholipase family protein [Cytophaga sp.]
MNQIKNQYRLWIDNLYYSFSIQLLLNNIKKNQILLIIWLILFAFVTRTLGDIIGIPYLFLDPEYLSQTDFKSFFIIGVSLGIFITAFHITVYILDSFRFPFLGATPKPFTNFCLNNSVIPVSFVLIYVINIASFQYQLNYQGAWEITSQILGLLVGLLTTILALFLYFKKTNKDIFIELASTVNNTFKKYPVNRVNVLKNIKNAKRNKYQVNSYFSIEGKIEKAPEHAHFDKSIMLRIFDQNHLNAVIVEIFLIILIIALGLFRDNPIVQIPAAASGILFFSIIIMFTGAFSYWLRGWALSTLVIVLVVFNFLLKENIIQSSYQVFGINYNKQKALYGMARLDVLSNPQSYEADKGKTIKILEKWRAQYPDSVKPKMVFVCASGGGQRASVWTMRTLQYIDSITKGNMFKHTRLITGASGGIIGASFYRELRLQELQGKQIKADDPIHFTNISKDVLNPIVFSMVVNDLFFRFQKFTDGKHEYYKDRGYAFEQKMHENTNYVMYKSISDYKQPEEDALIPMLILSPTIINDGRKLFISPLDISYMTTADEYGDKAFRQKLKGIEFRKFYEEQEADQLHFMSALRMSATFPYITPNVDLPSEPAMEIMDAGLSDNFGIKDAVQFMYVFKDWIASNTSGVVFVNIRDSQKDMEIEKNAEGSIIQKVMAPIGSLYSNWDYYQDFNNDNLLEYAQSWLNCPMDIVEFEYIPISMNPNKPSDKDTDQKNRNERAALSWHLTTREKESLRRTIMTNNNQYSVKKLQFLLDK